jgi:hypothetical protein
MVSSRGTRRPAFPIAIAPVVVVYMPSPLDCVEFVWRFCSCRFGLLGTVAGTARETATISSNSSAAAPTNAYRAPARVRTRVQQELVSW